MENNVHTGKVSCQADLILSKGRKRLKRNLIPNSTWGINSLNTSSYGQYTTSWFRRKTKICTIRGVTIGAFPYSFTRHNFLGANIHIRFIRRRLQLEAHSSDEHPINYSSHNAFFTFFSVSLPNLGRFGAYIFADRTRASFFRDCCTRRSAIPLHQEVYPATERPHQPAKRSLVLSLEFHLFSFDWQGEHPRFCELLPRKVCPLTVHGEKSEGRHPGLYVDDWFMICINERWLAGRVMQGIW